MTGTCGWCGGRAKRDGWCLTCYPYRRNIARIRTSTDQARIRKQWNETVSQGLVVSRGAPS